MSNKKYRIKLEWEQVETGWLSVSLFNCTYIDIYSPGRRENQSNNYLVCMYNDEALVVPREYETLAEAKISACQLIINEAKWLEECK